MGKFIFFILLFTLSISSAQVKIGENPNTIDTSSILELESSDRVLVITRVTNAEMTALTPLAGALIYNEDAACIFYFDGIQWNNLCEGVNAEVTWGTIIGDLNLQTDLSNEFAKYVDLTNSQSIAGEKTHTDKLTVNTGDLTAQSAEFLGRVKGENGTAPEDFVTKAQLDALGSGIGTAWGAITGTLTDQTDLASEFANYVDITNVQSVAGEKTFTNKLTVGTGDLTAQSAEFLGRVKGEDGTAPEDFVTKAQLDVASSGGHTGTSGSIFFAGTDSQPTENNATLFWDNTNNQLGVGTNAPNSPLHIEGAITKPIAFGITGLNENHHTVLISIDAPVFLPDPTTCEGRIYIIKKRPGVTITIPQGYLDTDSNAVTTMGVNVLHLQSNGFGWEQIN